MNVLDLFSGIGGFSLGLERAGMRTVAFCERDEYCRAVLRKHWPDVPCFDDIHAIDADGLARLGRIDLVCGGFPCQPFSVAGKQRAQEDDRYLWPEMRRVIALARPAWVVGENVAGLISLALDDVLADLEALDYAGRALVIPACAVDARHRRDRVWIIAADTRDGGQPQFIQSLPELWSSAETDARGDGSLQPMAHAGREGLQRPRDESGAPRHTRTGQPLFRRSGDGRLWAPEPAVGRVAHGVPNRVDRIRALGNAVVPQVVEEIGRAIMKVSEAT